MPVPYFPVLSGDLLRLFFWEVASSPASLWFGEASLVNSYSANFIVKIIFLFCIQLCGSAVTCYLVHGMSDCLNPGRFLSEACLFSEHSMKISMYLR